MTRHFILLFSLSVFILVCSNEKKPGLHGWHEILEIMDNSSIEYVLEIDEEMADYPSDSGVVLSTMLYLKKDEDGYSVQKYELSDSLISLIKQGDSAFARKDFNGAFTNYYRVREADSEFHKIYTFIGDTYYIMGDYDSAIYYFKKALDFNPVDYDAHWFLADSYRDVGRMDEAVYHITCAHLLNRNHEQVKIRMKEIRKAAGHPWKDFEFKPRYKTSKENGRVLIKAPSEWSVYAMVKAVWKYEPGYVEETRGKPPGPTERGPYMEEEKEAILAYFFINDEPDNIATIISNDFIEAFIWYEIWGPQYPHGITVFPQPYFDYLVEYLNRYH